ncbi:Excinuclease ABC C subunit domain protein [Cellulophaga algicola DSM 14237]|uniref:Excinuclease cho n=1 Tax=Cellulophaga algicola (strain DSM 14237 / IC166 / ACAM 630) TaxID=688270 RepID=E6X5E9_CELAD|nr:exonuclease domain-containing protein [Cellulophaga algicola]ADV50504.1 Excinuclease ABC C subunit domain protein [Cellulophaga algicola DSM 14237]
MTNTNYAVVSMINYGRKPLYFRTVGIVIHKCIDGDWTCVLATHINPEERIPLYIQEATGLTDVALLNAPSFSEVADTILRELQGCILVGHNISFLHYHLKTQFRHIGYAFDMPQLCTVRLSKKLIPNMASYELPYLTSVLGIPFDVADSLEESNDATSALFQRLLALDENEEIITALLQPKPKLNYRIPKHIAEAQLDRLPKVPGIYKFQNEDKKVIYVGKAKDIKKRVLSHFTATTEKELLLCTATYFIDFEPMGSELVALLREADLITKLDPYYNYIQKKKHITYLIVPIRNKKGILQLKVERRPFQHTPTEIFLKRSLAIERLAQLTEKFELCPSFTGVHNLKTKCSTISSSSCKGICREEEAIEAYNDRVTQALDHLNNENENFVILEKGRNTQERSFVLVLHGVYQGFGFIDKNELVEGTSDLLHLMDAKEHSFHSAKTISAYRKRNPYKIKFLETKNYTH